MKNQWVSYINGNYQVRICLEGSMAGTKIRENDLDNLIPSRPESMDIQISTYCLENCSFCYAGCNEKGHLANLNLPFFDTIPPYAEIALNFNNPIPKDELYPFLVRMRNQNVIVNATVNQNTFMKEYDYLRNLQNVNLLYGLGVSLTHVPEDVIELSQFTDKLISFPNLCLHVIVGIVSVEELLKFSNTNLKILFLGYKYRGRGQGYCDEHITAITKKTWKLEYALDQLRSRFSCLAFDNAALVQLNIKNHVSPEEWERFYMGEDATYTFFIDAVQETFSGSSLSETCYPIDRKTVQEMFNFIREQHDKTE